jgi:hypothetical protein
MTPAEFLAMEPRDHPDFVHYGDPRCESAVKAGREDPALFMPNLVELIRRIGGPDAIPNHRDPGLVPLLSHDDPRWDVLWEEEGWTTGYTAMLRDLGSRRGYATLYRMNNSLFVHDWHPREDFLQVTFDIPADWSVSAWGLPTVMIEDVFTASHDLDRLAAEALDYWIGAIQKATETYVHIRRDRFVF